MMTSKFNVETDGLQKMPVLFLGHGSPMNAIQVNEFTKTLSSLGDTIPRPRAILCVSAHWMTKGTGVTAMKQPKTIHDFYGFPQALFEVEYPAAGSPELAKLIQSQVKDPVILSDDHKWGLDHGTWSILKHVYPLADIPVVQLSLDMSKPAEFHFQLGQKLAPLREQGVLIIGSGNIVHNLQAISWDEKATAHDWAIEFDEWAKAKILDRDFSALTSEYNKTQAGQLSVPTPDHYYPLLYNLGAATKNEEVSFIFEGMQNAAISMRSVRFG